MSASNTNFGLRLMALNIASTASRHERLNSARLSPVPLVFKTVHETFTSHGSSMIWCLLRIPHYPFILDSFKSFGGFRLDTIAVGFAARTAILGCLYIMAMSV